MDLLENGKWIGFYRWIGVGEDRSRSEQVVGRDVKKKGDTAGTGGIWRLMQKPSTMEASWNL